VTLFCPICQKSTEITTTTISEGKKLLGVCEERTKDLQESEIRKLNNELREITRKVLSTDLVNSVQGLHRWIQNREEILVRAREFASKCNISGNSHSS